MSPHCFKIGNLSVHLLRSAGMHARRHSRSALIIKDNLPPPRKPLPHIVLDHVFMGKSWPSVDGNYGCFRAWPAVHFKCQIDLWSGYDPGDWSRSLSSRKEREQADKDTLRENRLHPSEKLL